MAANPSAPAATPGLTRPAWRPGLTTAARRRLVQAAWAGRHWASVSPGGHAGAEEWRRPYFHLTLDTHTLYEPHSAL